MMARFIRFYGMTDAEVLRMPARRFFVLHEKITQISAEEDLRAFMNQHGKPEERQRFLIKESNGGKSSAVPDNKPTQAIIQESPYVAEREAVAGDIEAIREAQRAASERLKQEWLEKQAQSSS